MLASLGSQLGHKSTDARKKPPWHELSHDELPNLLYPLNLSSQAHRRLIRRETPWNSLKLVEQETLNLWVQGSSPWRVTNQTLSRQGETAALEPMANRRSAMG